MIFDIKEVRQAPLFSILSEAEKDAIFKDSIIKTYSKKEKICQQGENYEYIFYILDGFSKLYYETGKINILLSLAKPTNFVGLLYLFSQGNNPYTLESISKKKSTILQIKKQNIIDVCMKNSRFMYSVSASGNDRSFQMLAKLLVMSRKNVRGRLAMILLHMADYIFCNDSFEIPLTRIDIANLANISHENTVRLMSELDRDGIIKLENKKIEILNRTLLEELALRG